MKKSLSLFCVVSFVFLLAGCKEIGIKRIIVPNYDDFEKVDEPFYYDLNDGSNLNIGINVCTTGSIIVNDPSLDKVKVEVVYNDDEVREKINFRQYDDNINITKTNQKSNNCSYIKEIDSYVRISLPKGLNDVSITINSYDSELILNSFNAQKLYYSHVNGDITIDQSKIFITEVISTNGNIKANEFEGREIKLKTVNGRVGISFSDILNKVEIESTNGTVSLNNIETKYVLEKTTNGDIELIDSFILNTVNLKTVNGQITVDEINKDINLPSSVTLTGDTTNGSIHLNNVYIHDVTLTTVNGNIEFENDNKDFSFSKVTCKAENGNTQLDY